MHEGLHQLLRSFESLVQRSIGRVQYREMFQLYVEGQRKIRLGAGKAKEEKDVAALVRGDAKWFRDSVDTLLMTSLFSSSLSRSSSNRNGAPDGLAFPLYISSSLQSSPVLLPPPGSNAALRKDVVVGPDAFLRRSIAAPYLHSVRRAVAANKFDTLFEELVELNNLRFILPFSTLHNSNAVLMSTGADSNQCAKVNAESVLSTLSLYLRAATDAVSRMVLDESKKKQQDAAVDYWRRTPPISFISFTQECDIFISLLSHRRDTAIGPSLPSVTHLVESADDRVLFLAKYLLLRNVLKHTREAVLSTKYGDGAPPATVPVVLASFRSEIASKAFSFGVPCEHLARFASPQTSTLLGGGLKSSIVDRQSVSNESSRLSKYLQQRERNMQQRKQPDSPP